MIKIILKFIIRTPLKMCMPKQTWHLKHYKEICKKFDLEKKMKLETLAGQCFSIFLFMKLLKLLLLLQAWSDTFLFLLNYLVKAKLG